jgi:hypothetical protein
MLLAAARRGMPVAESVVGSRRQRHGADVRLPALTPQASTAHGVAIGLQGLFNGLNCDVFVGAAIARPERCRTAGVTSGINLNHRFPRKTPHRTTTPPRLQSPRSSSSYRPFRFRIP